MLLRIYNLSALTMCLLVFTLCSLLFPPSLDACVSRVIDAECHMERLISRTMENIVVNFQTFFLPLESECAHEQFPVVVTAQTEVTQSFSASSGHAEKENISMFLNFVLDFIFKKFNFEKLTLQERRLADVCRRRRCRGGRSAARWKRRGARAGFALLATKNDNSL